VNGEGSQYDREGGEVGGEIWRKQMGSPRLTAGKGGERALLPYTDAYRQRSRPRKKRPLSKGGEGTQEGGRLTKQNVRPK